MVTAACSLPCPTLGKGRVRGWIAELGGAALQFLLAPTNLLPISRSPWVALGAARVSLQRAMLTPAAHTAQPASHLARTPPARRAGPPGRQGGVGRGQRVAAAHQRGERARARGPWRGGARRSVRPASREVQCGRPARCGGAGAWGGACGPAQATAWQGMGARQGSMVLRVLPVVCSEGARAGKCWGAVPRARVHAWPVALQVGMTCRGAPGGALKPGPWRCKLGWPAGVHLEVSAGRRALASTPCSTSFLCLLGTYRPACPGINVPSPSGAHWATGSVMPLLLQPNAGPELEPNLCQFNRRFSEPGRVAGAARGGCDGGQHACTHCAHGKRGAGKCSGSGRLQGHYNGLL